MRPRGSAVSPSRSESCPACPSSCCCWRPAPSARRRRPGPRSRPASSSTCRTPTTNDVLADRGDVPSREGGRRRDARRLLLRRQQLLHRRARRHAPGRAGALRAGRARPPTRCRSIACSAPAVVVDVTAASAKDADYQVSVADLQRAEREHGPIPPDAILLVRTGFSQRWPDAAAIPRHGRARRAAVAEAALPRAASGRGEAGWSANRPIKAMGIDTASIDYGQSTQYESHRVLYAQEHPGLREPDRARAAAAARRLRRRPADEDRRRQRRAAAGSRDRAVGQLDRGEGSGVYVSGAAGHDTRTGETVDQQARCRRGRRRAHDNRRLCSLCVRLPRMGRMVRVVRVGGGHRGWPVREPGVGLRRRPASGHAGRGDPGRPLSGRVGDFPAVRCTTRVAAASPEERRLD